MTEQREREAIQTLASEFEAEHSPRWGWTRIVLRVVVLLGFIVALGGMYTVMQYAGVLGGGSGDTSPQFTDVPSDYPQQAAIEEVAAAGIMEGVGNGLFSPDQAIDRAAFAKVVVRTMNWEAKANLHTEFQDVTEREFLGPEDYIAVVSSKGVMSGIQADPPLFGPDQELQTGHAVIVFVRASRDFLPEPDPPMAPEIAALSHTSAVEEALNVAAANNLLVGTGIDPQKTDMSAPITRAQVAALAANVRQAMEDGGATSVNSAEDQHS